jgi:precorrin-6Y C5,15-methyltransferase (decarboxylating)
MTMSDIDIIGIGMGPRDLTPFHMELIQNSDLLIGGARHLDMFPEYTGETLKITRDIPDLIRRIREKEDGCKIVVLASGDPLFYGIGGTLSARLPNTRTRIHPNVSSVAAAFSKISHPWHDAKIISFHTGVPEGFDFRDLAGDKKLFFLTAPDRGPAYIARLLANAGTATDFDLCVLENLNHPDKEKIRWFVDLEDIGGATFSDPNVVILLRKDKPQETDPTNPIVPHETHIGMRDDAFSHSKGLITKSEVRALSLSKLRLTRPDHILWDIGAGSGSLGIEAALLLPFGQVYSIEKNQARILDIQKNAEQFGLTNVSIEPLCFPEGGESRLPVPDRIFIGGGGANLDKIVLCAAHALAPGGIMVINTVVLENMTMAMKSMTGQGMAPEAIQVQINRSTPIAGGHRFTPLNPVWILSGRKPIRS